MSKEFTFEHPRFGGNYVFENGVFKVQKMRRVWDGREWHYKHYQWQTITSQPRVKLLTKYFETLNQPSA